MDILMRVTSHYFCAGVVFELKGPLGGKYWVTRAAPILRRSVGKRMTPYGLVELCKKKRWEWEFVKMARHERFERRH